MNQQAQTKMLLGIGAITAAVIAGYFGLDYFAGKKAQPAAPTTEAAAEAGSSGDYAAAVNAATESALANAGDGTSLTAEDARRIGEEVARQVATEVARSIVDQKISGGSSTGGDGSSGLTEADARRIGEEEGRRVAQEVASATIQQMLAANAGSGSGSGLTAEEAEQIGLAAGRRAAKQVAASTAREIVRNEFGGTVVARADGDTSASSNEKPASSSSRKSSKRKPGPGSDALRAWWATPASGDFGLLYAGQPQNETAIALLFNEQPADSALNQSVKVYDYKGKLVTGSWETAANPRMAVLRGLKPGRYTVVVEPALANASGKAVSKGQHGPVYVT
ncbi:MAG: hypothetical protein V4650_14775 [Pseudomonadota bacterium]